MSEWISSGWSIIDAILLLAAVVLFFKMRGVLGQGDQIEKKDAGNNDASSSSRASLRMPEILTEDQLWERAVKEDLLAEPILKDKNAFMEIMRDLRAIDPLFNANIYIERVSEVYEVVTSYFAKGDLENLRPFFSDFVYQAFEKNIQDAKARELTMTRSLIGFKKVQIEGLYISETHIKVAVSFLCELVVCVKDKTGQVVEGDPVVPRMTKDHWTFVCDRRKEPRWIIEETY